LFTPCLWQFFDAVGTRDLTVALIKAINTDLIPLTATCKWFEVTSTLQRVVSDGSLSAFPTLKSVFASAGMTKEAFTFMGMEASAALQAQYTAKVRGEGERVEEVRRAEVKRKQTEADHDVCVRIETEKMKLAKDKVVAMEEKEDMVLEARRRRVEKEHELRAMENKFEEEQRALNSRAMRGVDVEKNGDAVAFLRQLKELDVDLTVLLNSSGDNMAKRMLKHAPAMESFMNMLEKRGGLKEEGEGEGFEMLDRT